MSSPSAPDHFDSSARERIRQKLLTYAKAHGIGVIRLADRISRATPRQPEIPIKTLQRFLKGERRTNDMYVAFFQSFASDLPDTDPIGDLGKAMADFYGSPDSNGFSGQYSCIFVGAANDAFVTADLSVTPDIRFCRAVERSEGGRLVVCDGVLVARETTAILALHDRTTRDPRQYLLTGNGAALQMAGIAAVFRPDGQPELRALSASVSKLEDAKDGTFAPGAASTTTPFPAEVPTPAAVLADIGRTCLAFIRRVFNVLAPKTNVREIGADNMAASILGNAIVSAGSDQTQSAFLIAAEQADQKELARLFEKPAHINQPDPSTGLTALHLAVGRDVIGLVRFLVEHGAICTPDVFGRMPSIIAAESEVSDEVFDFIVEVEGRVEGV